MKDLLRELQDLQVEVEDFIDDMEGVQSKFASRLASLDEYYDKDRVLQKARSILARYEALKTELEAEIGGEEDPFLSKQLTDLVESINAMKSQVSSLSSTLKGMGKGLVPKTLEQFARVVRKTVKTYFDNPRMVTHSKALNKIRDTFLGAEGKKFFQTVLKIKDHDYPIFVVEPLDGDYTKMPSSGNVFWRGKDISTLETWTKEQFKGKGVLSEVLDPFESITEDALLVLKTEMQGYGMNIGGNFSAPAGVYHFKPGTVLRYTKMRSRGDFFLQVVKLNAGRNNEYGVGESINVLGFGTRESIEGKTKYAIGSDWGRMYVLRKYIEVKNPGSGKTPRFDPGL